MRNSFQQSGVPAIVLCLTGTGMATVRALAEAGVQVHALSFSERNLVRYSRYAHKVYWYDVKDDQQALLERLIAYAKQLGGRPVVFPTCDTHALLLAKHRERLLEYCRVWTNDYDVLGTIVNKQHLYRHAVHCGVPTIPSIYNATLADIERWSAQYPAPYLLKPPFEGAHDAALQDKNLRLDSREALLDYTRRYGVRGLIVQRLIRGGDGHVYDCYGLCVEDGRVLAMASHRRLRQHLPDLGATSYGEIPSGLPAAQDERLFAATLKLLSKVRYHGIFGIEWLHERGTDNFYLIDFNARPFSSIGHLYSCGVNLPWLAYRELIGDSLSEIPQRPAVKHKLWIDLDRDLQTFRAKRASGEITCRQWLVSLLRTRSFAYFNLRDPKPGLMSVRNVMLHMLRFAAGQFGSRRVKSSTAATLRKPAIGTTVKRI